MRERKDEGLSQKNLLLLTCLYLSACSTTNSSPNDPLEAINRPIFSANNILDHTLLRPTVLVYDKVAPAPIKTGVSNFYRNMGQIQTFFSYVLQFQMDKATTSLGRLLINGTLGLGGIFDVATEMGVSLPKQDFGQTFAKWGWQDSTYIVLPILGPSTVRDGFGYLTNMLTSPPYYLLKRPTRNEYFAGSLIDKRLQLTSLDSVVGNAGVDQYSFVRSSFLQNRNYSLGKTTENNAKNSSESMTSGPPE
jgi:phospholipid-binding lipoprotein MlaA